MSRQVTEADELLAGRIRAILALRKLSITELSKKTEIAYRTLQNYLSGTHRIPVLAAAAIANEIGVPVDTLVTGNMPWLEKDCVKNAMLSTSKSWPGHFVVDENIIDKIATYFSIMYKEHYSAKRSIRDLDIDLAMKPGSGVAFGPLIPFFPDDETDEHVGWAEPKP